MTTIAKVTRAPTAKGKPPTTRTYEMDVPPPSPKSVTHYGKKPKAINYNPATSSYGGGAVGGSPKKLPAKYLGRYGIGADFEGMLIDFGGWEVKTGKKIGSKAKKLWQKVKGK